MEMRIILVLLLALATSNVIVSAGEDGDTEDSTPNLPDTPDDLTDNTDNDVPDWNIPGRGAPDTDAQGDPLDNFEDTLDDMVNQGQGMAGMPNVFRSLGQLMSNLKRSQNANNGGQSPRLPPKLQNNPCFQDSDKMQDFTDEMSDLMSESDTDPVDSFEGPEDESSEMIEKMSLSTLGCVKEMFDNHTMFQMCRKFSKKSVNGFQKLITVGINCVEALSFTNDSDKDSDDDDDDDDLDLPHQLLIMKQMKQRPFSQWSKLDISRAFQLAPETVDDDVIHGLPDDVFEDSLEDIGRLVTRKRTNPSMQAALRQRLTQWRSPSTLTSTDVSRMGVGLAAFDPDDLDDINPESISDADLSTADFDFDDDDPRGLAIGRLMRKGVQRPPSQFTQMDIKKMFRFMKNDAQFIKNLDSSALVQALPDISKMELDEDEARPICRKIRQSPDWDEDRDITEQKLYQLGHVIAGCGEDFLDDLPPNTVQGALASIKDVDFDESEAGTLLEKLNIGEFKDMTPIRFRQIGKLAKGLKSDDIDELPDSVVSETLEDLDDIDMEDWKRKKFVYKAMAGNSNKLPAKFFRLRQFANSLSVDDIDDIDVDDIKMNVAQAGNIRWRSGLASFLYHKLQAANPRLNVDDLSELGTIVTGMSEEDINNMPADKTSVLNLASALADHDDDLTQSQTEAVTSKIRQAFHFDDQDTVEMDENEVMQAAPFLQYLPQGLFNKIKMAEPAREAFLTAMNRGSKSKISREKLMYLTEQGQKMASNQMNNGETEWDDKKVAKLNGMVLGMPADTIRKLPGPALVRNIEGFSRVPLAPAQGEAVMQKVMEHDSSWHCKRERLAQVGPFLKHLSEDKLKTICKSEMAAAASAVIKGMNRDDNAREERRNQGFVKEEIVETQTKDGETRVVNFIQSSVSTDSSARRKRRAVAGPTCDEIKMLGKKAALLKVTKLQMMDKVVEFPNCFETLGSIGEWNKEQLAALLEKAKMAYGDPTTWSPETVRRAGSILAALTPGEISQIKLTTVDAIASIGRHLLFSHPQMKAGFYRWLNHAKMNDISKVQAEELASLGHFVCGPEPAHILKISATAIKGALNVIGQARSCDISQIRAYAKKATDIYGGNVGSWNEPVIAEMGIVIGGLLPSQLRMLTANQIAVISTEVIPYFSPDVIQSLTTTQLNRFSTNQANAVTQDQYRHLSAAKQDVISGKAYFTFNREDPSGDASRLHVASVAVFLVVIGQRLLFDL